jgi:hypothetical protein
MPVHVTPLERPPAGGSHPVGVAVQGRHHLPGETVVDADAPRAVSERQPVVTPRPLLVHLRAATTRGQGFQDYGRFALLCALSRWDPVSQGTA